MASASSRSVPRSSSLCPSGRSSHRTTQPFSSSNLDTHIPLTPIIPIPVSGVTVYTATSIYSQDSYLPFSPIPFSQSRVDRRRFCVMIVSAVPWMDQEKGEDSEEGERSTPRLGIWSLDGERDTLQESHFAEAQVQVETIHEDDDGGENDSVSSEDTYTFLAFSSTSPPPLQLETLESLAGDAHTEMPSPDKNGMVSPSSVIPVMKTRKKKGLIRMLSRLSVSSRRGTRLGLDSPPPPVPETLLPPSPLVPPQIEVVVPSPGLNVNLDVDVDVVVSSPSQPSHSSLLFVSSVNPRMKKHNRTASEPIQIQPPQLGTSPLDTQARTRQKHHQRLSSTTSSSSWKLARPASPLPRHTRHRHKRPAESVALPGRSPVPPLPVRAVSVSMILQSPSGGRSIQNGRRVSMEMWAEVEGRLRARVMKSGMDARGVPSPLLGA